MREAALPGGERLPVLGLGTWRLGERESGRTAEVASIRHAIDLGYRLVDTAEMYGEGGAETVVGQALAEAFRSGAVRREQVFVVSKVYPHNASRRGTLAACDRSRRRLGLDRIDLYLLHWRGSHPLADTVAAMHELVDSGHIGQWGVSNFDVDDLHELAALEQPAASGGAAARGRCAVNQVYFSVSERGPQFSLLPLMRERAMPLMAYSPIDQGRLANDPVLADIGAGRGLSAAQVALAWVVGQPGVVAIPKALSPSHLQANWTAAGVELSGEEQRRIDAVFPAPTRKMPLAMI